MSPVAIANIGPIHSICHEDVDQRGVKRPSDLKQLQIRKCNFDVSPYRIEPYLFFPWWLVGWVFRIFQCVSRPLQSSCIGSISYC